MKKLAIFALLLLVLTLSACSSTVTGDTGYDLTDLNTCIDDMVNDTSSQSCPNPERKDLLEAYIKSFESMYDVTDASYTMSDLEFSSNKSADTTRVKYWFQYSLLPDVTSNNYTTFKDIVKTMLLDMREINTEPEYLITGEFFALSDFHYIFRTDLEDNLEGEIQVHRSQVLFSDVVTETETFLQTYGIDSDLETMILDMISINYSVYVVVDVATQEYQYNVYRTVDEADMTLLEVESLVETTLNNESLTKVPWTID